MEKEKSVLSTLIEKLDEVKDKLTKIDNESAWIDCTLPKDMCRSYTNIKNILDSLVKKITDGKDQDDDISLISDQNNKVLREQPQFKNVISSEDYLSEIKKIINTTTDPEVLYNNLLTFQELLGDLLYSVCQINNYQLMLPSGITAGDLLKVKDYYIFLWESIYSTFGPSNCGFGNTQKMSNTHLQENSTVLETKIAEIKKALQSCMKEMSKVKLEIEHYFKFNIIEMQYIGNDTQCEMADNVTSSKNYIKQNKQDKHHRSKKHCLASSLEEQYNKLKDSEYSKLAAVDYVTYNHLPNCFSIPPDHEMEENDTKSYIHPSKVGPWMEVCDQKPMDESCGDVFNYQFIYPQDFLLFDPTVIIQSKVGSPQSNSLPKIYSIHSVNEEIGDNKNTCYNVKSTQEQNESDKLKNFQLEQEGRTEKESSIETVEDLFTENVNVNRSQSQSVDLQAKISSLFNMLRTNQINDDEDIFDATPLQIENSDLFSKPGCTSRTSESKLIKNRCDFTSTTYENNPIHKLKRFKCKNLSPQTDIKEKTYQGKLKIKEQNYRSPESCNYVYKQFPVKLTPSHDSNVIYDKRSLIELYRKEEETHGSNSGSYQRGESNFPMWPVTAEYIYVSKVRGQNMCQSVSSNTSISLKKSFEKSFFSLHLNKRYEQNQLYDGDLIVLENTTDFRNEGSSSYSLMNQTYVAYDNNQHKNNNQEKDEKLTCHNNYYEHSKEKDNRAMALNKGVIPKLENSRGVEKTMAVQYADCRDSFMVKTQNFKRENYDFLKINGYDDSNNWNSFISIFTSKVGPSTQLNHHRMFRKIINNIGTESFSPNNLFNNVHTLTSNGGPFRLFDVNGYPLTDSAGNVLKDPYSKSVVHLDSTGFPKDDVKVFDAAGNSPKDINFDPTQKPKTNSIIIKLTDNFKRPLHLFDKYGRPLTDSHGKLLVNIHGRPLLRFDNFGRPNTDYRGGPLYTDNGLRWSYKTGESLSKEQMSNETLRKFNESLEDEPVDDSCKPISLTERTPESEKQGFKHFETQNSLLENKTFPLNRKSSDIWLKVESVLQQLPKKKLIDQKASQTSVIINNVSIKQNSIEKEFLKSIIYHNNIIQQDINQNKNYDVHHSNKTELMDFTGLKNGLNANNNFVIENQMKYVNQGLFSEDKPIEAMRFPFYNNIVVKNTCSKCFANNQMTCIPGSFSPTAMKEKKNINTGKPLISDERDFLLEKGVVAGSVRYPTNGINKTNSIFTFKNPDYLNNLCNEILKCQMDCQNKRQPSANSVAVKKNPNWTDTSYIEFTSSAMSKYTTEFLSHTESPYVLTDPCRKVSQEMKLDNSYNYKTYTSPNNFFSNNNQWDTNTIKTSGHNLKNVKTTKCGPEPRNIKDQAIEKCQRETFPFSSKHAALPNNVHNETERHNEINVAERIMNELEKKLVHPNFTNRNNEAKGKYAMFPKKDETKYNYKYAGNKFLDINHYKPYHYSSHYLEEKRDSPFRFTSETQIESAITEDNNVEVKYIREKTCELDSNTSSVKEFTYPNRENKHYHQGTKKDDILRENDNKYQDELAYSRYIDKAASKGCLTEREIFNYKKNPENKYQNFGKIHTSPIKKRAPPNKECNIVSFLGSPVKYVLNKLENKRSSKPHNINKINPHFKPTKNSVSKANTTHSNHVANTQNKNKPINETKLKTPFVDSQLNKIEPTFTAGKIPNNHKTRGKPFPKQRGELLAFQSKSCTEILEENKAITMSYSGNEIDSQNANCRECSKYAPSNCGGPKKCSSETSFITSERYDNTYSQRGGKKYEPRRFKRIDEQTYFKPISSSNKRSSSYQRTGKKPDDKNRKQLNKKNPKMSLISSKNKGKDFTLFKKLEPKRKHAIQSK